MLKRSRHYDHIDHVMYIINIINFLFGICNIVFQPLFLTVLYKITIISFKLFLCLNIIYIIFYVKNVVIQTS